MLKRALMVLAAIPFAATWMFTTACSHADDDDATEDIFDPIILAISPDPTDTNFFFEADAWVQFDDAPDSVSIEIEGVEGTQSQDGDLFSFDITGAFESNTTYTMRVVWSPSTNSPLSFEFSTGPHGQVLENEEGLINTTFEIDLASANFVEPPGIGAIIASQLEGFHLLFMPLDTSDLAAGLLHALGGLGVEEGGSIDQDPCSGTLPFTYGSDGLIDTGDDAPAVWDNPRFVVGPTNLELAIQGTSARLTEVFLEGVVHPELDDIDGMTFAGVLDTRALDDLLSEGGGEGAACEFLSDTLGIECEECGGDFPGPYCLDALATDMVALQIPGLVLEQLTCVDVLDRVEAGVCTEEDAADYDLDGDGDYTDGCPEWVAR
jgi:hypothetical protein